MGGLTLTGERTLPGIAVENYWFRRHEAAYDALAPFCTGAAVLDAGCGEGYGAARLRQVASRVVGLDYLPDVTEHASRGYPEIGVVRGDLQHLPLRSGCLEVVANLQVIEHLHDQPGFIAECARVLRPAGTLLVTTPNRRTFSPGRDTPLNPFHTRELDQHELADLLAPHFSVARMWGLGHGRFIRGWEKRNGSLIDAQLAAEPPAWPRHVQRIVRSVRAVDFAIGPADVDSCLDLICVAIRT